MEHRELGTSGLVVSAIGLGCMGMSRPGTDDAESIRTLRRALDLGITLFDTADVYGQGANERLVGATIRGRRSGVVVATKFGLVPPPGGGLATDADARPERVRPCCEGSLQRLGVDMIDLLYLHRIDPAIPVEDTVGAMADLVKEGKVRFLGLSEAGPQSLRRAHATHPIAALESEYSLWTREPERTVLPVCRELGIGLVPFSPLGRGFLSGTIRDPGALGEKDVRRTIPRFHPEHFAKNRGLVDRVEEMARAKGCTTAQLALAWILAKGADIVPIPGTKHTRYLEENAAAVDLALTPDDIAAIEEAFPIGAAAGLRYPADSMRLLGAEAPPRADSP
jgi:aryl-alcohol dehydrogenase-like predicted oxidoreductase